MFDDVVGGRQAILQSLERLQRLNRQMPNLLIKQVFFDAKSEELINIFRMGTVDERNRFITLVRDLDPANLNRYQAIMS
jgi:hypothetical protein